MKEYIAKIKNGQNLSQQEIQGCMREIMSGEAAYQDIAAFLLALREKGPTVDEITGAAQIMRQFVLPVVSKHKVILDTCGTGGDKKNTFNISTVTALVVAGAGVVVAKHGNRSVTSKCGSACVLEGLGVNVMIDEKKMKECLDEVGIAFLFAQRLHPAMKNVAPVRKELKVETIFNILGPLTNPANATHQIIGVYSRDLTQPLAYVLKNLGLKRAMVVHGDDGLDEITTTGKTYISEYNGKDVVSYDIDPQELNFDLAKLQDLEGGDLNKNMQIVIEILSGQRSAKRDIVLLNSAYALYISEKAKDITQGIRMAEESIDSGKALSKLNQLKDWTNRE